MPRLIDADVLKERAIRVSTVKEHCYMKAVGTHEIDKAPTVKVAEVVHGRWIGKPIAGYCDVTCSVCRRVFPDNRGKWNYCPNCGAKMDGDI